MHLEPRQLVQLATIVQHESFEAAAEALGTTQPSLSRNMRQLAKRVGSALFERIGRKSVATELGRTLAQQGLIIREAEAAARSHAEHVYRGRAGHLNLGAPPTLADNLLVPAITEFLKANAGARIDLRVGLVHELDELLTMGAVDVVLGPIGPARQRGVFKTELIHEDTVGILCRAEHPLARREALTPDDLDRQRWVAHSKGSYLRFQTEDALSKFGVSRMDIALETDSTESAFRVTANSDLITTMPRLPTQFAPFAPDLTFIDLGSSAFMRPIGLIRRYSHVASRLEDRFTALLRWKTEA